MIWIIISGTIILLYLSIALYIQRKLSKTILGKGGVGTVIGLMWGPIKFIDFLAFFTQKIFNVDFYVDIKAQIDLSPEQVQGLADQGAFEEEPNSEEKKDDPVLH